MRKVKGLFLMMMAVALTACSSDDESAPGSLVGTIHFEGIRK